jgi:hypothetical protein
MHRNNQRIEGSFRDPDGFLFRRDGTLYRQVNQTYTENYQHLMESGLYQDLTDSGLLVPHVEVAIEPAEPRLAYKVIRPEEINFISHPYEWCFSQLKDAALATLIIQQRSLSSGMTLKDSSAYNIQFYNGRPTLIDTLSFEIYREGEPWAAYRQFCQHFLAPLALMSKRDIRLARLLQVYIDGIPIDLAGRLLPRRTRLNFGLLTHIHLHAAAQKRYTDQPGNKTINRRSMSRRNFQALLENLEKTIRKIHWSPAGTAWGDYYESSSDHYRGEALEQKEKVVRTFLEKARPASVWDLGANTGRFSRCASDLGIPTVAFDFDPGAVERNYLSCVDRGETRILPLVMDLINPSPAIGWANRERASLSERGPVDAVLALALIHHLAISNNVPLQALAEFFSELCAWLVIEFVPKSDSRVISLLSSRADIFPDYHLEGFESAFGEKFSILQRELVPGTERSLYLMKKR